jgi:transposase
VLTALTVVQIARLKKSCRRCERMVQMPAPSRPIPGSMAGAGLLEHIGAETLARAMTIIETAKLNGLDPQAYLADILARINAHKINRLGDLLP